MIISKFILLGSLLISSTSNGQDTTSIHLIGQWKLDQGKNIILNFLSDSIFSFKDDLSGKDNFRIDNYVLDKINDETILTLNFYSGSYVWSMKSYLIHKINSKHFKLQPLEYDLNHRIIFHKWKENAMDETYNLLKVEG